MKKIGKYMVYNPKKGKPVKYYEEYYEAMYDAQSVNERERDNVLILEVVGEISTQKTIARRDKVMHDTREFILV